MGQKVNPNGFRYGISKKHNTTWYADKDKFSSLLLEDQKIYDFFDRKNVKCIMGASCPHYYFLKNFSIYWIYEK